MAEKELSFKLTCLVDGEVFSEEEVAKGKRLSSLPKPTKEFHSFSGWEKVPSRMPARDITVEGHFVPNTYKLTFLAGEDVVAEQELPYGAPVNAPETPQTEGCSFSAWENLPDVMPGEDITVKALFVPNTYNVTFTILNADSKEAITSFTYPCLFGDKLPEMDIPEKEHYSFSGWENVPETMPAHDVVLEGTLSMTLYKLTRVVDGEVFREEFLPFGAKVSKKPNPEKEGFYFSGFRSLPATMPDHDVTVMSSMYPARYKAEFFVNEDLNNSRYIPFGSVVEETPVIPEGYRFEGWEDCPETMPARDIVVHGKMVRNEYRLVYRVRGRDIHTDLYLAGAEVVPAEPMVLDGFRFNGWKDLPALMPSADIAVDGDYILTADKVAFVLEGQTVASYATEDGEFVEPAPDAREGYTFCGWQDAEMDENGVLNLKGAYKLNAHTVSFMVDGIAIQTEAVAFGAPIAAPTAPAKDNMTFEGWSELPDTMPDHDLEVSAIYTENVYHIAFVAEGNLAAEYVRALGAEVEVPEAPEKEGYTFAGWIDPPAVMPAYDVTVNGVYNINTYTLTYVLDGEIYKTLSYEFDADIEPEIPEEKDGMRFGGWANLPKTMPASDITVEGTMGDHDYNITYMVEDEVVATVRVAEGMAPVLPEETPAKEGYAFEGWDNLPETMPADNVVATARFTANVYHLSFEAEGQVLRTLDLPYGAPVVLPDDISVDSPAFSGWGEMPETMPANDLIVQASFERKPFALRYEMDGELFWQEYLYPGDPTLRPEVPEKEGHTFAGWRGFVPVMPDENVTVVGFYIPHTHQITYMAEGEEVAVGNALFGSVPVAPVIPEKSGHAFAGWDSLPDSMPDCDLTVSAIFTEGGEEEMPEINLPTQGFLYRFCASGTEVSQVRVQAGETPVLPDAPYKYGYSFLKWDDMPAEANQDTEVHARYTPNAHHVLYLENDIVLCDQSVNFGDPVILPESVSAREDIAAWHNLPAVMPDYDVVAIAEYVVPEITVTCYIGEDVQTFTLPEGAALTLPELTEREGYDLVGWQEEVPLAVGSEPLTFHANYRAHEHFIYFMCCGQDVASFKVAYGQKPEAPEIARVVEGILYDTWDNVPESMPDSDVTVYAVGRRAGCVITFMAEEEVIATLELPEGVTVDCPDAPEKEGCTFKEWSNIPEKTGNETITSVAVYTPNPYTVEYRVKGMPFRKVKYAFGTPVTPIEAPKVKKRRFVKWGNLPETMPAADLTVDALYVTQNSYLLAFEIDGKPFAESVLETGTRILMPSAPEKDGFVFSGWDKNVSVIGKEPITVSGHYYPLAYTLTYMVNGESYATYTVDTGSALPCPEEPQSPDMVFHGWTNLPRFMPARDVVTEAIFGATYTVIFMADGSKLAEYVLDENQPITIPEAPEKEGFTFEGWDNVTELAQSDLICTAKYKPMTFRAVFTVEGETYAETEVVYGHALDLPVSPEKEGYVFDGWENLPEAMPAADVTLSALFSEAPVVEEIVEEVIEEQPEVIIEEVVEEQPEVIIEEVVEEQPEEIIEEVVEEQPEEIVEEVVEEQPEEIVEEVVEEQPEEIIEEVVEEQPEEIIEEVVEEQPEEIIEEVVEEAPVMYTVLYRVEGNDYATFELLAGEEIPTPDVPSTESPFIGWEEHPAAMPEEDIVISAIIAERHKVTFMVEDEVFAVAEYFAGDAVAIPDGTPILAENKVFAAWTDMPETMPDSDITVNAQIDVCVEEPVEEVVEEPVAHTVTFICGDVVWAAASCFAGEAITLPAVPELADDAFDSWSNLPEVMPDEDITVYAKLKGQLTVIRFVIGDEVVSEVKIASDATIEQPEVTAPVGYTFSGWSSEAEIDEDNVHIYRGSYVPNKHVVTFMVGKKILDSVEAEYGMPIPCPENPVKENRTFFGWKDMPETMPNEDLKLQAIFEARFVVTYLIDGAVFHEDVLAPRSRITPPEVSEKYGYTFSGWSVYPKKLRHEPLTIKGNYVPNTHCVTFMCGKEVLSSIGVNFGEAIPLPADPIKDGHAFKGWELVPDVMPNEDVILTAQFEPLTYKVNFVTDGAALSSIDAVYGSHIVLPIVAQRIGHTFVWDEYPETMPANDIVISGRYVINSRTITYMANGANFAEQTFCYGEKIVPIAEVPKAKKRRDIFVHWDNLPTQMGDSNIVVVAVFEDERKVRARMKTVSFMVGKKEYAKLRVLPGEIIRVPEEPKKLGYKLARWEGLPDIMPSENIKVNAVFVIEKHSVNFVIDGQPFYTATLPQGAKITPPPAYVKPYYTFVCWDNLTPTMPNYDFDVTAKYEKTRFKLTYLVEGKVVRAIECAWGESIPNFVPDNTEVGVFESWQGLPAVMPTSDLEVVGIFEPKEFKITYAIKDGLSSYAMLTSGTKIVPPSVPTCDGRIVTGWNNMPANRVMPTRDIIIEAIWGVASDRQYFDVTPEGEYVFNDLPNDPAQSGKPLSKRQKKKAERKLKKQQKKAKKSARKNKKKKGEVSDRQQAKIDKAQHKNDVQAEINRMMRKLMR